MGKSSSKPAGVTGVTTGGVAARGDGGPEPAAPEKRKKGKKGKERPLSDPGVYPSPGSTGPLAAGEVEADYPNFYMKPRDAAELSGKYPGGKPVSMFRIITRDARLQHFRSNL